MSKDNTALKDYFQNDLGWGSHYQSDLVFSFLCEAAGFAKGGIVLDAGAGAQRYKPFFEDSHYVAQEHPVAGQKNKGLQEFDVLCDVRSIPLKENSVDLVLSTSSLEHMEYPEEFFSEAFRVLTPGGALFVQVPFIYEEHEIPYDFQRPTRFGLERYYRNARFDPISVEPSSSSIYATHYIFTQAVLEDSRRLGKSATASLKRRLVRLMCRAVGSITMYALDNIPETDAKSPIGWIAKGYKPGKRVPSTSYGTKADFIKENAQCGKGLYEENGLILPRKG